MKRSKGFTLIEVMIVVVIIAILATVAYPSYRNSVIKGNRANAQAFLMEVAQREQQHLFDSRSYTNDLGELNMSVPGDVSKFYTVSITLDAGPPPGFTVTAQPRAGTMQAGDADLSIDNVGNKLPADLW